jgi:hypothetical protein
MSFCPIPVVLVGAKIYLTKIHKSSPFVTFLKNNQLYLSVQLTVIKALRNCDP